MKRTRPVVVATFLAILSSGAAYAAPVAGDAGEIDRTMTASADCQRPTGPGAAASTVPRAAAVILRSTDTEGRYVAREIGGYFRPHSDVAIYSTEGDFVVRGKIEGLFGDEAYVDVPGEVGDSIGTGYVVFMNYADGEAREYLRSRRETIGEVAQDARLDAAQRQREIAGDERRSMENREKWQEEMTKLKMQFSYQYGDYNYAPSPYGYGP